MGIKFDFSDFDDLIKDIQKDMQKVSGETRGRMSSGMEELKKSLEDNTPLDSDSENDRHLKEGIFISEDKDGNTYIDYEEDVKDRALYTNYGTIHQKPQNYIEKTLDSGLDRISDSLDKG